MPNTSSESVQCGLPAKSIVNSQKYQFIIASIFANDVYYRQTKISEYARIMVKNKIDCFRQMFSREETTCQFLITKWLKYA